MSKLPGTTPAADPPPPEEDPEDDHIVKGDERDASNEVGPAGKKS